MKDIIKILYYNKQQFIEFREILSTTLSTLVHHLWPILIMRNTKTILVYTNLNMRMIKTKYSCLSEKDLK